MSKMTIKRSLLKSKTCFLEGSRNEDFLQFLASPTVLGHSFEAFRRAAAQKQMVQSTLLRPFLSGGPKGWNSGFDETHDIHNFFQTFIHTLDRYPWLLHFGFPRMITCFKVLVSNIKDDNKSKTSKVKDLFLGGVPKWGFSSISDFSCGLGPHFWNISARSSAKANKWCKALSSILLSQVAQRAKIQGLTKCVIFDFQIQF